MGAKAHTTTDGMGERWQEEREREKEEEDTERETEGQRERRTGMCPRQSERVSADPGARAQRKGKPRQLG